MIVEYEGVVSVVARSLLPKSLRYTDTGPTHFATWMWRQFLSFWISFVLEHHDVHPRALQTNYCSYIIATIQVYMKYGYYTHIHTEDLSLPSLTSRELALPPLVQISDYMNHPQPHVSGAHKSIAS